MIVVHRIAPHSCFVLVFSGGSFWSRFVSRIQSGWPQLENWPQRGGSWEPPRSGHCPKGDSLAKPSQPPSTDTCQLTTLLEAEWQVLSWKRGPNWHMSCLPQLPGVATRLWVPFLWPQTSDIVHFPFEPWTCSSHPLWPLSFYPPRPISSHSPPSDFSCLSSKVYQLRLKSLVF